MPGEKPGPLRRLRKLCDEMEAEIGRNSALLDNHLPPIFFTMSVFIIDVRKCADEILAIIEEGLKKCSSKTE